GLYGNPVKPGVCKDANALAEDNGIRFIASESYARTYHPQVARPHTALDIARPFFEPLSHGSCVSFSVNIAALVQKVSAQRIVQHSGILRCGEDFLHIRSDRAVSTSRHPFVLFARVCKGTIDGKRIEEMRACDFLHVAVVVMQ